jgi:acyl-coenzyme A synthetase/AMP-(fatty) acid ligase
MHPAVAGRLLPRPRGRRRCCGDRQPDERSGKYPQRSSWRPRRSADELMQFVSHRVAPYNKIRIVEFVDEIPKSPSGKILRQVLVERDRAAAASI